MGIILELDEEQTEIQRRVKADLRQRQTALEQKDHPAVTDFSRIEESDVSSKDLLIVGAIILVIATLLIIWVVK